MADEHQIKDFYQRWFDAVTCVDCEDLVAKYIAPDFVEYTPGLQGTGLDAARQSLVSLRTAFPDAQVTVTEVLTDGDRVAGRLHLVGTHSGAFLGIPPTGERLDVDALEWGRVRDDQWVEHWLLVDALSLMQQLGFRLGVCPTPDWVDD